MRSAVIAQLCDGNEKWSASKRGDIGGVECASWVDNHPLESGGRAAEPYAITLLCLSQGCVELVTPGPARTAASNPIYVEAAVCLRLQT